MIQQDEQNFPNEDYFSYTGSTRESWGRCSSFLPSDEESYPDFRDYDNDSEVCLSQHTHMVTCMHACTLHIMFDLLN